MPHRSFDKVEVEVKSVFLEERFDKVEIDIRSYRLLGKYSHARLIATLKHMEDQCYRCFQAPELSC